MGDALGVRGEDAAWARYRQIGYRLVARNWRCPLGELDLVVRRGDLLIFCEVKTRTTDRFGAGFAAVTSDKQRRVRRLAAAFIATISWAGPVRFDVASVSPRGSSMDVELFIDAF